MALEDFIQKIGDGQECRIEITDMKAFGAEAEKALSKSFHISENYHIHLMTEKEFFAAYRFVCGLACLEEVETCFYSDKNVAVIKDSHKNYPPFYGEEIAHGLRWQTYDIKHPDDECDPAVDEFFGRLGYQKLSLILQDLLNIPEINLAPGIRKISDFWTPKTHQAIINACAESNNPLACHPLLMGSLQDAYEHASGYAIALIAFPIAEKDEKLFYRSDNEIRKIYFEPAMRYDWTKYSQNNPVWQNVLLKVRKEIEKMVLEGN